MHTEPYVGVLGVEQDLLADPAGRGERVADERVPQRGRGGPALHEPGVGRVHLRDLAIERARLEHLPRGLDFEDLGHVKRAQKFVIAPVSAPWASRAYLARKPLV